MVKTGINFFKGLELLLLILISSILVFNSCVSRDLSDENLTSKKTQCDNLTQSNALTCCLQYMSSKTGSDSKDAFCAEIKNQLAEKLRTEIKKDVYNYCKENGAPESFQNCWDKLHVK